MSLTGWRRYSSEVSTPKLPPPPRMAQNRSSFSLSLATRNRPSAVTTSAETRLSHESPNPRARYPMPPPSVRPAMPVVEMMPPVVAGAEARHAGAPASHGEVEPVLVREVHGGDDVAGVGAAHDYGRPAVDHGVVDLPRLRSRSPSSMRSRTVTRPGCRWSGYLPIEIPEEPERAAFSFF